jgi:hypothetical protein
VCGLGSVLRPESFGAAFGIDYRSALFHCVRNSPPLAMALARWRANSKSLFLFASSARSSMAILASRHTAHDPSVSRPHFRQIAVWFVHLVRLPLNLLHQCPCEILFRLVPGFKDMVVQGREFSGRLNQPVQINV